MILKGIRNSLAFRLPVFYKYILQTFPPNIQQPGKEVMPDIKMVLLCGSKNLGFLIETLNSIFCNFKRLPHITIFTDSNLSKEKCLEELPNIFRRYCSVIDSSECITYHRNSNNSILAEFANSNPMGLKLAAILQALGEGKPVLYCDTDVLWLEDPLQIIELILQTSNNPIHLSYDFQPAYDQTLLERGNIKHMMQPPYYCAGIMLIKYLSEDHRSMLNRLLPFAVEQSNHFTEQTIFAAIQKQAGDSELDNEKFAILLDDRYKFQPVNNSGIVARHYIGPVRHLFWRDAFFQRMGLKS